MNIDTKKLEEAVLLIHELAQEEAIKCRNSTSILPFISLDERRKDLMVKYADKLDAEKNNYHNYMILLSLCVDDDLLEEEVRNLCKEKSGL